MVISDMICRERTIVILILGGKPKTGAEREQQPHLLAVTFWFRIDELVLGHFEAHGGVSRILPSKLSGEVFMEGPSKRNRDTHWNRGITGRSCSR